MFTAARFYIVVGHESLIIKKKGDRAENIIDFTSFIPNVPFYYHFFDQDKTCIKDMKSLIKKLKIKNAIVIIPDDAIDIDVDKKVFSEFFIHCGVKKVEVKSQCFFLSLENKKYIAISRTTRNIVLQYIVNSKCIAKKYYDKDYTDIEQIALDAKNLYTNCEYDSIPIYISNINNDMEKLETIGTLISLNDYMTNIMSVK